MTALYRCLGCGHEWRGKPGPVECPRCLHPYVRWLNYEALFGGKRGAA
jgi:rubrerythrin